MTVCLNCKCQPIYAKDECKACYSYRARTGHRRPSRLIKFAYERRLGLYELGRRTRTTRL